MSVHPTISVIVPVYCVEKYLDRCVNSILKQTFLDIEIILVDDGSPDNCGKICDDYAKQDSRIRVIHKENEGLGFARNSGLDIALGDYISFIDSDDYIELNMYETMVNRIHETGADTCLCGHYVDYGITKKKTPLPWGNKIYRNKEIVENIVLNMIGNLPEESNDYNIGMCVWQGIFSRKIIEDNSIRFVSERDIISEDIMFDLEYYPKSKCVVTVAECFNYYCMNGESLTHKFNKERFEKSKTLYIEIIKRLKKQNICGELREKRSFLGRVRRQMVDLVANTKSTEFHRELTNILNDTLVVDTLNNYPIDKMIRKYKLFFNWMKEKRIRLLYIYLRIIVIRDRKRANYIN